MAYKVLKDWRKGQMVSLVGYIDISYDRLVEKFGEPTEGDGYKVDAEWLLDIDGEFVTIYNYKDGVNYNGPEGTPVEDITDWHIGGATKDVEAKVRAIFEK
jgi:hypothetical protein